MKQRSNLSDEVHNIEGVSPFLKCCSPC